MPSPWLTGLRAVVQPVAGALPAVLIVLFAGILALTGLACEPGRRSYALAYADRLIDLAAVIVGRPRTPTKPTPALPTT
ncbi:hypothetical protein [Frankia sp. QA3]|uniref:hypothetical protein n=1 Tax=Frankia sp. QA3 TaxID=710111 RepID=UPI000269C7E6|nr:hypothetical protein [Frankia sp. QA3]EIV93655.1 hypothetical protein FraQA3DRAFT_3366 [Frankia sp. QA3]